jgi:hypothetical protein
MTPGTIIIDNEFEYSDKTTGKKILVVLNDGTSGSYIVIKTTSQDKYKGITFGCQSSDRYPNFFLPKGSCCLNKDTWVMLDQFFEFRMHEVVSHHFSGRMNNIGLLAPDVVKILLKCAIECDDISVAHANLLEKMLAALEE